MGQVGGGNVALGVGRPRQDIAVWRRGAWWGMAKQEAAGCWVVCGAPWPLVAPAIHALGGVFAQDGGRGGREAAAHLAGGMAGSRKNTEIGRRSAFHALEPLSKPQQITPQAFSTARPPWNRARALRGAASSCHSGWRSIKKATARVAQCPGGSAWQGGRAAQGRVQVASGGRGLALDAGTVVRALFITIDKKV